MNFLVKSSKLKVHLNGLVCSNLLLTSLKRHKHSQPGHGILTLSLLRKEKKIKFFPTIIGGYFWNDLPFPILSRPTEKLSTNSLLDVSVCGRVF